MLSFLMKCVICLCAYGLAVVIANILFREDKEERKKRR